MGRGTIEVSVVVLSCLVADVNHSILVTKYWEVRVNGDGFGVQGES